jgi:hypothetical protein
MNNIAKYLIIVVLVLIIIIVIITLNYEIKVSTEAVDDRLDQFLKNDSRKLTGIRLTKEMFDQIENDEYNFYYFENECPDYKEDILLCEDKKDGERYYIPEKESLIKLPKNNHKWTKKFEGVFFFK